MSKSYSIFLHYKQGDDFAAILKDTPKTEDALREWAMEFESRAQHLCRLADMIAGKDIKCNADCHHIEFYGDEDVLAAAAEKQLIDAEEWDDSCSDVVDGEDEDPDGKTS